jgi:hypothetical protein
MSFLIDMEGTRNYNEFGDLHREDGPAVELENGYKAWFVNGTRHRLDGPAVERPDDQFQIFAIKEWWVNGKRHRLDGPAIEWKSGSKEWWFDGVRHRDDGPAIEYSNGFKEYWIDGLEVEEWWVMGKNYDSKLKFNWMKEGF